MNKSIAISITKRPSLLVILIFNSNIITAQFNLVNNPSFEMYSVCPSCYNFYNINPNYWYQCTNKAGIYSNNCGGDSCSAPYIFIGKKNYQPTHSGQAYIYI